METLKQLRNEKAAKSSELAEIFDSVEERKEYGSYLSVIKGKDKAKGKCEGKSKCKRKHASRETQFRKQLHGHL